MATSTLGNGTLVLAGTTSGTTTVTATAVAGTTTLTLPAATDTLVGKATTDTLTNKTLTGAAMNGTLGATTASTANVTTLTTSSTVTHNGGTANGVAYLDGAKVLTTGSALVFDGTKLGVGAAATEKLQSNAGIAATGANLSVGSLDAFVADYSSGNSRLFASRNGVASSTMQFWTTDSGGAAAERMRISSATGGVGAVGIGYTSLTSVGDNGLAVLGNVGIGTSSPSTKLDIAGTLRIDATSNIYGKTDNTSFVSLYGGGAYNSGAGIGLGGTSQSVNPNTIIFTRGAYVETARFDSSGNLLVGTTNTSPTTGIGNKITVDSAAPYIASVGSASTNSNVNYTLYSTGAAAYRFYVGYGGTISATSTTITGISDQRLKENIRDLDDGLATVMALKPRKFDWKTGKGKNIKNDRGFIAQEFETVFPDMVEEWKDPAPEGEEPYKAVNANLIPTLVKAIQEQQAIITTLTARISALESA